MRTTQIDNRLSPEQLKGYLINERTTFKTLEKLGISFSDVFNKKDIGLDEAPNMISTASNLTPIQFLRYVIPEIVTYLTTKRNIDDLVGYTKAGDFEDEEVVQQTIELLGSARPYGDKANPTRASFNNGFVKRSIVRMEASLEVGILEALRASKVRLNSYDIKKKAVAILLEIVRNEIGFYGYIDGDNLTYGILNDVNLLPYRNVATGASGSSLWKTKTMEEICADIVTAFSKLREQTGDNFDPQTTKGALIISSAVVDFLSTQNSFGMTVRQWLKENYPNISIKSSAFMNEVNGGSNVFYVVPDELEGVKVIEQFGQDKMRLMGVWNKGKSEEEFYANATAGCMVRIPAGVVRYSGI